MVNKAIILLVSIVLIATTSVWAEEMSPRARYIRDNYTKYEYHIPARDGTLLFTAVYVPNDRSKTYPMLMKRTPYSVGPYGTDQYSGSIGPSEEFERDGYIFVNQDVRGRFMSDGEWVNMRPQVAGDNGKGVDDATDAFDTIDWLIKNVKGHNGRVGQWGVSYPGYYTSVSSVNSHPALKAISPQAPIADWFFDDFHRRGTFALPMAVVFFDRFDNFAKGRNTSWPSGSAFPTHDGYQFFLDLGPLSNVNKKWFKGKRPFWNELTEHPNYDDYWKARDLLPHLKNTKPATLVVGGWYDTEDLYGPLKTYQTMSQKNRKDNVKLVMGPWYHGQWLREGSNMGEAQFGFDTSKWFRQTVLLPFFRKHLKGDEADIATATMFETGANRWRFFDQWPLDKKSVETKTLFMAPGEALTAASPAKSTTDYISDPMKPVPHSKAIGRGWDRPYMAEDQRFAARRPDVALFETEVMAEDMTIAGELVIDLKVATDKTAADFIVKLVDVFPGREDDTGELDRERGNRHELVRWGSIRGRFRESMSEPKPFVPGEVTTVRFSLYDVLHTIKRGHKMQILVQSSMFPFLDRNPQTYVDNIFEAKEEDFVKATHTIHMGGNQASSVTFTVLPKD